jgi:hypothetical protein
VLQLASHSVLGQFLCWNHWRGSVVQNMGVSTRPTMAPPLLTFPVATAELCPHSQKLLEALLVFKHTSNK